MLLDKLKKITIALLVVFFTAQAFAATTDLTQRFLDKANEAYEDGKIEDAYKYVNQALAVAKDESSKANVLFFAQTVYTQKLVKIQEHYDEMALIDIQMNLEKYPNIENTKIKKIIKQIVDSLDRNVWSEYLDFDKIDAWVEKGKPITDEDLKMFDIYFYYLSVCSLVNIALKDRGETR